MNVVLSHHQVISDEAELNYQISSGLLVIWGQNYSGSLLSARDARVLRHLRPPQIHAAHLPKVLVPEL